MKKHTFFTGGRGVGKSTLLQKRLNHCQGVRAGFVTEKVPCGGTFAVHMLPVWGNKAPSQDTLLFYCDNKGAYEEIGRRFDRLGCELLSDIDDADVIVMDELGSAEACAKAFQESVLSLLDGETPILGVLQEGTSEFLQQIAAHPNVEIICVTTENRDSLT